MKWTRLWHSFSPLYWKGWRWPYSLVRFLDIALGVGRLPIAQITINCNGHQVLIDTQLVEYLLAIE